jgi:hypothetical protein
MTTQPAAARSRGALVRFGAGLPGLLIGGLIGVNIGIAAARGNMFGPAFVIGVDLVITMLGAGLGALIGWIVGRFGARTAGRLITLNAGFVVIGAVAGTVLGPRFGITYHPPVTLHAGGSAAIVLASLADLQTRAAATADCSSIEDGTRLAEITSQDVGSLRGARLLATVDRGPSGSAGGDSISIEIGGEAVSAGAPALLWQGPATVSGVDADGRSGTATFAGLVAANPADKSLNGGTPAPVAGWPTSLSGTLTWSCGEWAVPEPID